MIRSALNSLTNIFGYEVSRVSGEPAVTMPLRASGTADDVRKPADTASSSAPAGPSKLKSGARTLLRAANLNITSIAANPRTRSPVELTKDELDVVRYVKENELSSTSYERLWATAMACKHVVKTNLPGDFVECGVMRGGHAIVAAGIFNLLDADRKVVLFDTFAGMTPPTEKDRENSLQRHAQATFDELQRGDHNEWCYASLEDVKRNFDRAGLLTANVSFVQGDVLQTLDVASNLPGQIAILRLDTDWYESTKKELEVLYPLLSSGGVLLIDDYGHWQGAKDAVDEYFEAAGGRPFLIYNDSTGRAGVKH